MVVSASGFFSLVVAFWFCVCFVVSVAPSPPPHKKISRVASLTKPEWAVPGPGSAGPLAVGVVTGWFPGTEGHQAWWAGGQAARAALCLGAGRGGRSVGEDRGWAAKPPSSMLRKVPKCPVLPPFGGSFPSHPLPSPFLPGAPPPRSPA